MCIYIYTDMITYTSQKRESSYKVCLQDFLGMNASCVIKIQYPMMLAADTTILFYRVWRIAQKMNHPQNH